MTQSKAKKLEVQIKKAGLKWKPGVSRISSLSRVKQNSRLGLLVDKSEMQRIENLITSESAAVRGFGIPDRFDWQQHDGKNWITDVGDQGNCGSCVAFASLATMEAQARIQELDSNWPLDLSENELFFGAGCRCSEGWYPSEALQRLKSQGVCDEECCPYEDRDQTCTPCVNREERFARMCYWEQITSIDERKKWLAERGPLVACMAVYRDFFNYQEGIYKPTPDSELAGYHAISCIGFDDTEQCWMCKNSWDDDWGEKGFFKIAYGAADIDTRFPMFGVSQISGPLVDAHREDSQESVSLVEYTVIEDSLETGQRILWAYVDDDWRYKELSFEEMDAVIHILDSSDMLKASYFGETLNCIYGWHYFEIEGQTVPVAAAA